MGTAAIYVRTSTLNLHGIDNSLDRQIDLAMAYAAERGWAVADEHIFVDAGRGATFEERRAFWRLMGALKPHPPFQVLIMAEPSRLGRDRIKTAHALELLAEAGVQVWFLVEDPEGMGNAVS